MVPFFAVSESAAKPDLFPWAMIFPDLLWISFWLLLIILTKDSLFTAINVLLSRLKHGAALKFGAFEIAEIKVSAATAIADKKFHTMGELRFRHYEAARFIMLVHKIFKSQCNPS